MDTDIVRKVFIRFLKDRGALRQFIECCQGYSYYKSHIGSKESLFILSTAFIWDRTPQGYKYWRDIDEEWVNLLLRLSETELKWPLGLDREKIKRRSYEIKQMKRLRG